MKITHHTNHIFPYITFYDVYTRSELNSLWQELDFLCNQRIFTDTRGAVHPDTGKPLSNNLSVWIDTLYSERNTSNILFHNRKLFNNYNSIVKSHPHWFFKNFDCGDDSTLLSYYENSHNYDYHVDNAYATALTWFYKKPKAFSGGDLLLKVDDNILTIEVRDNFTIIFPSTITHSVTKVSLDEMYSHKHMGRFCMTQFMRPNP